MMLDYQTTDALRDLKLKGMAQAYDAQRCNPEVQSLSFEERIALLIEAESYERSQRRQARLIRAAKLKVSSACVEDIDYGSRRGLDKQQLASLTQCQWVLQNQHLIITGPTGVGKTWVACAFGMQAIRRGMTVTYRRVGRLLEETEIARADGTLPKLRAQIAKSQLLILDDWALAPLTVMGRQDLLEFVEDRTDTGSVILASQLPVKQWHDYIDEPTLADAILDRILHRTHKIEMHGGSMRKKHGIHAEGKS